MKMNPEVKARWVAALRSGEYTQGRAVLRQSAQSFCCLGVLCDLYAKDNGLPWEPVANGALRLPIGSQFYPPDPVRDWAGFHEDQHLVRIGDAIESVAVHNDGVAVAARTFAEIADAIEAQL